MADYQLVVWRRVDVRSGHCVATLDRHGEAEHGVDIDADELVSEPRRTYALRMSLSLDAAWRSTFAYVHVLGSRPYLSMTMERSGEDAWIVNGRRRPRLDGCLELDIAASPLTNTMAIRRLGLGVGEEAVIRVAWIDVPSLQVTPEEQGYRRIGPVEGSEDLEAYEFWPVGGRTYRLSVDTDGLVVDYQDLAERIRSR